MTNKSTLLLEHHLKELKLPTFQREYRKLATQCAAEGTDHPGYLLRLAELELIDRHQRMVQRRIRAARFPAVKSLDTFDFLAIPSVNKQLVMELARCEYIERRENIIAVGNSGTGKTHIALGLGLAACQRGMSVGFTTAAALVHELMEARAGWMESPGHRRNILEPSHMKVNIGIAWDRYNVQMFQHFEGDYVEYQVLPQIHGGDLKTLGRTRNGAHLGSERSGGPSVL